MRILWGSEEWFSLQSFEPLKHYRLHSISILEILAFYFDLWMSTIASQIPVFSFCKSFMPRIFLPIWPVLPYMYDIPVFLIPFFISYIAMWEGLRKHVLSTQNLLFCMCYTKSVSITIDSLWNVHLWYNIICNTH